MKLLDILQKELEKYPKGMLYAVDDIKDWADFGGEVILSNK